MKSRNLSLSERGFNFETFMWLFTRLSALAMYLLILTGFIAALITSARTRVNFAELMRWAFLPKLADVPTTSALEGMLWFKLLWRLLALALLLVTSAHGVHGVLAILDDYFSQPGLRRTFRNLIIVFWLIVNAIGLYALLTA